MKTKTIDGVVVNELTIWTESTVSLKPTHLGLLTETDIINAIETLKADGATHFGLSPDADYNGACDNIDLDGYIVRWETKDEAVLRNIQAEKQKERVEENKLKNLLIPTLEKLDKEYQKFTIAELLIKMKES